MFCGWRLDASRQLLIELGSGTIEIDLLSGDCSFNGTAIPQVSVAADLRNWLRGDLNANDIPLEGLTRASLRADLQFSSIATSDQIDNGRSLGKTPEGRINSMLRCTILCDSEIATDEAAYRSRHRQVDDWPKAVKAA